MKTKIARDPKEMTEWINQIQREIEKNRGYRPRYVDIKRSIVNQFKGKFIV